MADGLPDLPTVNALTASSYSLVARVSSAAASVAGGIASRDVLNLLGSVHP